MLASRPHTPTPSRPQGGGLAVSCDISAGLERFSEKQEQTLGLLSELKTEQMIQRLLLVRLIALLQASEGGNSERKIGCGTTRTVEHRVG